jgi:DNA-binding Xre family transcriptional regulator
MTKQDIQKLFAHLKKGDQKEIANLTGLSNVTVNKFFNGNDDSITDENAAKIVVAAKSVIDKRKSLNRNSQKLINSL